MNRAMGVLLAAVIATTGFTAQKAVAKEKPAKAAVVAKQARWHGEIVNFLQDQSAVEVRKKGSTWQKSIYFDNSTKWTLGTKVIDRNQFKLYDDVICLGTYDGKGKFHATRIDLRRL